MTTPFRIDFADPQRPTITVDGHDMTADVTGVMFVAEAADGPPLLVLSSRTPAKIAGLANVSVEPSLLAEDIASRVRSIDADALRAQILADPDSIVDIVAATIDAVATMIEAPDD